MSYEISTLASDSSQSVCVTVSQIFQGNMPYVVLGSASAGSLPVSICNIAVGHVQVTDSAYVSCPARPGAVTRRHAALGPALAHLAAAEFGGCPHDWESVLPRYSMPHFRSADVLQEAV